LQGEPRERRPDDTRFGNLYLEWGSPKQLTAEQVAKMNQLTRDLPEASKVVDSGKDDTVRFIIPMNSNEIVLVKLVRKH
jgi:xylan 1,4-beta-xylosidase